jgi:hypothetical protein
MLTPVKVTSMKHQHTVHCAIKTMAKTPSTPENKAMAKRTTNDMKAAVSAGYLNQGSNFTDESF